VCNRVFSGSIFERSRCTSTSTTFVLGIEAVVEDVFEHHGLRDGAARLRMRYSSNEYSRGCNSIFSPVPAGLVRDEVEGQVAHREPGRFGGLGRAADEGLHPREQFRKGEGLGQVIVPARLQTADAGRPRWPWR
jgi:hypothetical protein